MTPRKCTPMSLSSSLSSPRDDCHPDSSSIQSKDSRASGATQTPHTVTLALTTWNLISHDSRTPHKPQKRSAEYIETWNLKVLLELYPQIIGRHPGIKPPHQKQLALKTMENLHDDIEFLEIKLAALNEAKRVLSSQNFCQLGKVDNVAFLGALNLSTKQREVEIEIVQGQIESLEAEFYDLKIEVFGEDEDEDEDEVRTGSDEVASEDAEIGVAGDFSERPTSMIRLGSGIGSVRRSLGQIFDSADEDRRSSL
ncbi:hypothetical protein HYFRA_00006386 [Hymenoscyphus fraxineus]|uniref:Uncharacterized protein n=1 Tax=Hymenoscyphus fraxineus TaxID=746836 RepID=A0A9N9PFX6_9HELO|nr:hypothetical protein HYFRA_00006386 [Hymenoscyphus fraxineus]